MPWRAPAPGTPELHGHVGGQEAASMSWCAKAHGAALSLQKATSMDLPHKVPDNVSAKHKPLKPHVSGT